MRTSLQTVTMGVLCLCAFTGTASPKNVSSLVDESSRVTPPEHFVGDGPRGHFSNIQTAVNYAENGDIITLLRGVYEEDVTITDKWLTLRSEHGMEETELRSLTVFNRETRNRLTNVEGITIRDGFDADLLRMDLEVIECRFLSHATTDGFNQSAGLKFEDCEFLEGADLRLQLGSIRVVSSYGRGEMVLRNAGRSGEVSLIASTVEDGLLRVRSFAGATMIACNLNNLETVSCGGAEAGQASDNVLNNVGSFSVSGRDARAVRNTLIQGTRMAVQSGSADGESESARVTDNRLWQVESGLAVAGSGSITVERNLVAQSGKGLDVQFSFQGESDKTVRVTQNTIVDCSGQALVADYVEEGRLVVSLNIFDNCLSGAFVDPRNDDLFLTCNDSFSNELFNWDGVADPTGIDGNISTDPLFCDREFYGLSGDSPCAPGETPGCGQMGAFPVRCNPLTEETTSSTPDSIRENIPLLQFQNPVRSGAMMRIKLPSETSLELFDLQGRLIAAPATGVAANGGRQIELSWFAKDEAGRVLPTGIYFWKSTGPSGTSVRKMIVSP